MTRKKITPRRILEENIDEIFYLVDALRFELKRVNSISERILQQKRKLEETKRKTSVKRKNVV